MNVAWWNIHERTVDIDVMEPLYHRRGARPFRTLQRIQPVQPRSPLEVPRDGAAGQERNRYGNACAQR